MLGLKKKNLLYFFFGSTSWQNLGTNSNIFTIFHIEFAEKSQKIRTVALWYKKLYKKKQQGGGGGGGIRP